MEAGTHLGLVDLLTGALDRHRELPREERS
jgi:hypothetical protein